MIRIVLAIVMSLVVSLGAVGLVSAGDPARTWTSGPLPLTIVEGPFETNLP